MKKLFGYELDRPVEASPGTMYLAVDSDKIFVYGFDKRASEITWRR